MRFVPTPAETWVLWTPVLGLLHHAGHVLRVNHSGWPFLGFWREARFVASTSRVDEGARVLSIIEQRA